MAQQQSVQILQERLAYEQKLVQLVDRIHSAKGIDNIFIERLWRTVKYEEVYLNDYQGVADAVSGLGRYWGFYNDERLHQSLAYKTPASVYMGH